MFQIRFRFHAVARNICITQSRRANRLQALMDAILYPAQWFPSPLNRWCVRQACIPHACAYSYRATGALTLTYVP
jgi:hypothetical protein